MEKNDLTAERLREILSYDKETGEFVWLKRISIRIVVGRKAGCLDLDGYVTVGIHGKKYRANRLAWLHVTGEWPIHHVDHIDTNKSNNAWVNLRDVPNAVNMQNKTKAQVNNASAGLLGVSRHRAGKYVGHICINKKQIHLGYFDTADQAHQAYVAAKRELHPGGTL